MYLRYSPAADGPHYTDVPQPENYASFQAYEGLLPIQKSEPHLHILHPKTNFLLLLWQSTSTVLCLSSRYESVPSLVYPQSCCSTFISSIFSNENRSTASNNWCRVPNIETDTILEVCANFAEVTVVVAAIFFLAVVTYVVLVASLAALAILAVLAVVLKLALLVLYVTPLLTLAVSLVAAAVILVNFGLRLVDLLPI